ncbi:nitroreductase family protein [Patescibacteria group bacterium]
MTNQNDILKIHQPKPKYKVIEEISARFSPRFYSGKDIPKSHLDRIFEAARWAPSGHNRQPWFYYYAIKGIDSYKNLFSTLNGYNQSWAHSAPILILACAEVKNERGKNPFALYDLGASVISLVLQAQSLGYYSRQMGLFDKEKVKKIVKLRPEYEPFIIIAMGKIGNYEEAPEEIIEMESDPRPRKTNLVKKLK